MVIEMIEPDFRRVWQSKHMLLNVPTTMVLPKLALPLRPVIQRVSIATSHLTMSNVRTEDHKNAA